MTRFQYASLAILLASIVVLLTTEGGLRAQLLAALLLLWCILFCLGVALISWQYFGPVILQGPGGTKRCALTFDDGPDPRTTPHLLDMLDRHGVRATFFCVGTRVLASPDLATRMAREGHLLANHAHRHAWWTNLLPAPQMAQEIQRCQTAIESTTGTSPRFYRPPVGLTNPAVPGTVRRMGLTCVGWSVRTLDRLPIRVHHVVNRVRRGLRNGGIILLHDGNTDPHRLVDMVERIIEHTRSQGYNLVRLDELLEDPEDCPHGASTHLSSSHHT